MKICLECGTPKALDEFYRNPNGVQGRQSYCKPCMKVKSDKYHDDLRREVIAAYGGVCYCCGEAELDFLALDHANRDGKKDGKRGRNWYLKLKREGFPHKESL